MIGTVPISGLVEFVSTAQARFLRTYFPAEGRPLIRPYLRLGDAIDFDEEIFARKPRLYGGSRWPPRRI